MKENVKTFSRSLVLFFRKPKVEKALGILGSIAKYTFFVLVLLALYIPIIIITIQSFNTSPEITHFAGFSWKYWANVLTWNIPSAAVKTAILTTLVVAGLSTLASTILGTIVAIGIHSLSKKKRQGMVLLNQVPILNADIITGLSVMMVFKLVLNLFPDFFSFGLGTLVIAHIFFCIPYVVLSVLPKLHELDENLYDAALDLGCKPAMGIVKVIVPAISSGILSGMLIAFTMSIDDYLISLFNDGQRGIGSENLSIYIYNAANRIIEREVYAFSSILSLTVFLVLIAVYTNSVVKIKRAEHSVSKKQKI